jgi:MscS family membrane protein
MAMIAPSFVPAPLLRPGPYQILLWQWIALPICALAALIAGRLLGRLTQALLLRITARTEAKFDDDLTRNLSGPLALAWFVAVADVLTRFLDLAESREEVVLRVLHGLLFVAFFWALLRAVDVGRSAMRHSGWAEQNPASRSLLALGARVAKVIIVAMAVIAVVSALGYPVASLVAGLGLGGLAFALAAQKTVENLFGAFSIAVDQPIREGDYVRVDGIEGTVEMIGLRSTRIRTPDRTIICFPNGRLADMRTENLSERDTMRLACTLAVDRASSSAQVRAVLAGVEKALRGHAKIIEDGITVRLRALSDWSLDVEVAGWFRTTDATEFALIRQEMLLAFLASVEAAGTHLAFPTRRLYMEGSR